MPESRTPGEVELDEDAKRFSALHANLAEMYLSGISRTRSAAEAVRNAAAAIGTIYAAVLGLIFSTDKPLPLRGVIPAVFLGLAITGSSAYLAYIRPWTVTYELPFPSEGSTEDAASLRAAQGPRTVFLRRQTRKAINRRSYWLRVSVLALGLGVLFLPAAFIRHPGVPASSAPPSWPTQPPIVNDASVALYKSQLREVVVARKAASDAGTSASSLDRWFDTYPWAWSVGWVVVVVLSLAFVLVFARWWAKDPQDKGDDELALAQS